MTFSPQRDVRRRDLQRQVYVDPRHSIAGDERPLRVRPKSARDYSQSAATMMAALDQARFRAFTSGPDGVVVNPATLITSRTSAGVLGCFVCL